MTKNIILLVSEDKKSVVKIDKGELISLKKDGIEYMHQKGNKGWGKSDDEMFPIIGRTKNNNYKVEISEGKAVLDQHGILRELEYSIITDNSFSATFIKNYKKNTFVKNSKFPKKSTEENIFWPYDFTFEKSFILNNNTLQIDFNFTSKEGMPFMLGYHPAFLLSNLGNETLIADNKTITLKDVFNAGADALPILNCNSIILQNSDKNKLEISTKGFDNFMLWTEVNNMLCIEPITMYPVPFNEMLSESNMNLSKKENNFSVNIKVL
jgi:galactose mutarotase-like enzyme